jgi:hypothetical protein
MFTMVYQQMGVDAPNIHLSLLAFLAWMVSMYRISKQAKGGLELTFGDALEQFLAHLLTVLKARIFSFGCLTSNPFGKEEGSQILGRNLTGRFYGQRGSC